MQIGFKKCQQFSDRYGVKQDDSWGCIDKNDLAKAWWSGKHSEKHGRGKIITYEEGCNTTVIRLNMMVVIQVHHIILDLGLEKEIQLGTLIQVLIS